IRAAATRPATPAAARAAMSTAMKTASMPSRILGRMRRLRIKVTCGTEDAERCNQAFTVAAAAVAAGADVGLWLTGEAAWFGVPGKAEEFSLPHATPLADLRDAVLAGGQLT